MTHEALTEAMSDNVNHPDHYGGRDNPYEAIKVIEAMGHGKGFCYGNAMKYIIRAPHKGSEVDDLKKAVWYINRLIGYGEAEHESG